MKLGHHFWVMVWFYFKFIAVIMAENGLTTKDLPFDILGLYGSYESNHYFVRIQIILPFKNTFFFSTNTPQNFQLLYCFVSETKSTSPFILLYNNCYCTKMKKKLPQAVATFRSMLSQRTLKLLRRTTNLKTASFSNSLTWQ